MDEIPIVKGASGLTGRPAVVRIPEELLDPEEQVAPPHDGKTLPTCCMKRLHSFRDEGCGQAMSTNSVISDGCLCDIVREANEKGIEWKFDVTMDKWGNYIWKYSGQPIPNRGPR